MKWTETHFNNVQKVDIQLGEIVNLTLRNVQKVDVGYGTMIRQDKVGPIPVPRAPGDDRRQHE